MKAFSWQYWLQLFICLFCATQGLHAEAIRGKLPLAPGSEVRLYSMQLHQSSLVASAKLGNDSIFKIALPPHSYHGFYLLRWESGETELLYTGTQIGLSIDAQGQLSVVRGDQWLLYREKRAQLLQLRKRQLQLDSLLRTTPAEAFGYQKLLRKQKNTQKQLQKSHKKLLKAGESLWSRTLLFEFAWLGYTPSSFAAAFTADSALSMVSLADTLSLYHNRWPNFILLFVAAHAPASLSNVDSALLRCSDLLLQKAKEQPVFLPGSLQFLRMGMAAMGAKEAIQRLQREQNLLPYCYDPDQAKKLLQYTQKVKIGDLLPPIEGLEIQGPQLLVFWSAECMPCLQALTDLHLWIKNNRPELQVTAFALNADATGWTAEKHVFDNWTHHRLPLAWGSNIADQLGINQVPFYCIINSAGNITALYTETMELRNALEQ